jgi:hypothetical protein
VKPLAARVAGLVRVPRVTVAELTASTRPPWLDVLTLSTLVSALALAAFLATPVGQTALVDQWERTATAFGQPVDDAAYTRLQDLSAHWLLYSLGVALLTGPLLTAVIAGVLLGVVHVVGERKVAAATVLSIAAHANVIVALRQVVATPLNYLSESLASPTTFGRLLVGFDETSPLARFLGVLDVFVVWYAVVLAVGVAVLARRRVPPLALTFTGVYVFIALLLALAMAASGGTA